MHWKGEKRPENKFNAPMQWCNNIRKNNSIVIHMHRWNVCLIHLYGSFQGGAKKNTFWIIKFVNNRSLVLLRSKIWSVLNCLKLIKKHAIFLLVLKKGLILYRFWHVISLSHKYYFNLMVIKSQPEQHHDYRPVPGEPEKLSRVKGHHQKRPAGLTTPQPSWSTIRNHH